MSKINALVPIILLSACGGGSGENNVQSRVDASTALQNTFINAAPTVPAEVSMLGSANFSGFAEVFTDGPLIIGDMDLAINFEDSNFDGGIENIVDGDGAAYSGRVAIESGQINRSATTSDTVLSASLDGNLSGNEGPISVIGTLGGGFIAGSQAARGTLNGMLETTEGSNSFSGSFIVEQTSP